MVVKFAIDVVNVCVNAVVRRVTGVGSQSGSDPGDFPGLLVASLEFLGLLVYSLESLGAGLFGVFLFTGSTLVDEDWGQAPLATPVSYCHLSTIVQGRPQNN